MTDLPNAPQTPSTQSHRNRDAGKAKPVSGLVAFQQCLRALLVLIAGLLRHVGGNDCHQSQAHGFADLQVN